MWRLDLRNYFFPEISIKARKEHMDNARNGERGRPDIELAMTYNVDKEKKIIAVDVTLYSIEEEKDDPYEFRVHVFGTFLLVNGDDENPALDESFEAVELMLAHNGIQIIIGCARDAIHSATAKSAYGPLFLEPIYLNPEDITKEGEDD